MVLDESLMEYLSTEGYVPTMGARPLRRLFENTIEFKIAELIINEELDENDRITFYWKDEGLAWNIEHNYVGSFSGIDSTGK